MSVVKPSPDLPAIQETLLGWIVSEKCKQTRMSRTNVCHVRNHIGDEDCSIVQKFWKLESLPNEYKTILTEEQRKC